MNILRSKYLLVGFSLLIIVLVVFSCKVQQQNEGIDGNREKIISFQDSIVKLEFLAKNKKLKIVNDVKYYWCSANAINSNIGGYSGSLLDGDYQVIDKKKRLITKGQFRLGLKVGEWKKWYPNGYLRSIENWKGGFKEGEELVYSNHGQLLLLNHYKRGLLDGLSYSYSDDSTHVYKYKMEVD